MSNTHDRRNRQRLRAHFGFRVAPFNKATRAARMFESQAQTALVDGLLMWTELKGLALVTGPSGVGKSISLRRFVLDLPRDRFEVVDFTYLPSTPTGLLRSLSRKLGLPTRQYTADIFDAVQRHLVASEERTGRHPLVIVDDAEGMPAATFDVLRRLTAHGLDGETSFSLLLSATEQILTTLGHPDLAPLKTRIGYACKLDPFGTEDTRAYVRHHLQAADGPPDLFTDDAIPHLFNASKGKPRSINQLATQTLISAAVDGRNKVDARFMKTQIESHPLYGPGAGRRR